MDKRQLIEDIRRVNTTATSRFLAQFDVAALRQYLDHLNEAQARPSRVITSGRRGGERIVV